MKRDGSRRVGAVRPRTGDRALIQAFSDSEAIVRLAAFLVVLAVMAVWEALAPRRPAHVSKAGRWVTNLLLVALDTLFARLVVLAAPVTAALWAAEHGIGMLNAVPLPWWAAVAVSVVTLDLAIYGQHVAFHKVPWLWRLHRVHHTDLDVDVTTGVRFHPVEIALSLLIKSGVVLALGAPMAGVVAFEVLLNVTSLFNHGNVRLAPALDRIVRLLIVTPDMHRVHHSVLRYETDSNYGFNLSCWDRLFRTYRAQPEQGHDGMTIGQPGYRDPRTLSLADLLVQPFRPVPGGGTRDGA